ncbi:MAG: divalent-cation tolerance protein CutA [Acidobacteria bacterium]|nr:divalent-cation tolerance protein CutA [Acidobacteriota bacterium]
MPPEPPRLSVVLATAPDPETALRLARDLVGRRLAACVNIVPGMTSVYRWDGRVHEDPEVLMILKVPRAGFERLREALAAAHPYEVPEIVALPVDAAHAPYEAWAHAAVEE